MKTEHSSSIRDQVFSWFLQSGNPFCEINTQINQQIDSQVSMVLQNAISNRIRLSALSARTALSTIWNSLFY